MSFPLVTRETYRMQISLSGFGWKGNVTLSCYQRGVIWVWHQPPAWGRNRANWHLYNVGVLKLIRKRVGKWQQFSLIKIPWHFFFQRRCSLIVCRSSNGPQITIVYQVSEQSCYCLSGGIFITSNLVNYTLPTKSPWQFHWM